MATRLPVLFITPDASMGGSQNVLVNVASRLDDRFSVRVLVMDHGPLEQRLAELGVQVDVEPLPRRESVARFPVVARRWAKRLRGEVGVVHANGGKAALFGVALARHVRAPLLWMKHDHMYDGRLSRLMAARCDHVVCVSHAMTEQFARIAHRVSVVYPGAELRSVGSPADTEPVVLSLGRLDPSKGNADLLRAIALLRAQGIPAQARIVGPIDQHHPEHVGELRTLATELGLGADSVSAAWTDDLDAVYRSARVVALASRPRSREHPGEGAPLVLMEAMAAGRPVVGPFLAGVAEVVGDAGTLVDYPDPAQLASGLAPYLTDAAHAADVGARAQTRVAERMTLERTVEDLSSLYLRLARADASVDTSARTPLAKLP
jgi:glycosyltransferase involved in cell wall biosynthesis